MSKDTTANQTPPPVCKYMASLIPPGTRTVLEPFPGIGNIVNELHRDYEVVAPRDFFLLNQDRRFDCIVMNPPFSTASAITTNAPARYHADGMRFGYQALQDCMTMSDSIIALMPWFTLIDSDVRMRNLKNFGLISLTTLPRKTFEYARIQTVVLELRKGWKRKTRFEVFELL